MLKFNRFATRLIMASMFALLLAGLVTQTGLAVERQEALKNAKSGGEICAFDGGSWTVIDGGPDGDVLGLCTYKDGSSCLYNYSDPMDKGNCIYPFTSDPNQGPVAMDGGGVYAESQPVPPAPEVNRTTPEGTRVTRR